MTNNNMWHKACQLLKVEVDYQYHVVYGILAIKDRGNKLKRQSINLNCVRLFIFIGLLDLESKIIFFNKKSR